MTPTQRTLKRYRELGYRCGIVEKWNPHVGIRQDLFGIIDIIALMPGAVIGIQSTGEAFSEHRRALMEDEKKRDAAIHWLLSGARLELIGWRKLGGKMRPRLAMFLFTDGQLNSVEVECE